MQNGIQYLLRLFHINVTFGIDLYGAGNGASMVTRHIPAMANVVFVFSRSRIIKMAWQCKSVRQNCTHKIEFTIKKIYV